MNMKMFAPIAALAVMTVPAYAATSHKAAATKTVKHEKKAKAPKAAAAATPAK